MLLIFFIFVTISHASALLFAKQHQNYSAEKRKRLWQLHWWINGTLWVGLLAWIIVTQWFLPRTAYPLWVQITGLVSFLAGVYLSLQSRLLLGPYQPMGLRFFFAERAKKIDHSLYHVLNNPMYDGFALILIGIGLVFGIEADFYLAAASFLLLNIFLAAIENYTWKWNPF